MPQYYLIFLALIGICVIIGCIITWYCHSRFIRFQKVPASVDETGASVAKKMLEYLRVDNVQVVQGLEEDNYYDPHNKEVVLDEESFNNSSLTALASSCHEAGHAFQFKHAFVPMRIRVFLIPVASGVSYIWIVVLIVGLISQITGLIDLAIILYIFVVFFQIITLPVEFDASRRAMAYLEETGISKAECKNANSVLRSCALTYLAAGLIAIFQLLYLLLVHRNK